MLNDFVSQKNNKNAWAYCIKFLQQLISHHSSLLFSLSFVSRPHSRLAGGSSNLMGKFTQSVRRIVQDVKDEGTMSGLSREEVIEINERLILFRFRLEMSYETAKQALNSLMGKYGDSKSQRNIFNRYPLLKIMIKVGKAVLTLSTYMSLLQALRPFETKHILIFLYILQPLPT